MLLNVLGCTRTTLVRGTSSPPFSGGAPCLEVGVETLEIRTVTGIDDCNYSP